MARCLLIVGKQPIAGTAKTRLAAGIGAERTMALYQAFLYDTVVFAAQLDCALAFSFWPPSAAPYFHNLHPPALLFPQSGVDFGNRLLSGFAQAAAAGYDEIVLIGSDNPSLPPAYVEAAFAALADAPTVLGPCEDGGYYLIGMRQPQACLFHTGIAWSTEVVAEQTLAAAAAANLAMALVPTWYDIDDLAGLQRLHADLYAEKVYAPRTRALLDQIAKADASLVGGTQTAQSIYM